MSISTFRHPSETPVHGYLYSMVEMSVVRALAEYRVFETIPDGGISLKDLAAATKVDVKLLERFTGYLVAVGVLTAPSPGHIDHGEISKFLQTPKAAFWFPYLFDTFLSSSTRWLDFFEQNGAAEPQKSTQSPFSFAAGHPGKTFYEVLQLLPEKKQSAFNSTMTFRLGDMPITGVYDFTWLANYVDPSGSQARVRLVDVGGGKGQAIKAILDENPKIPAAQCVLEDREPVIKEAVAEATGILTEVQMIPHSFFDAQPVKGALVYYIRRVLNDWPDDDVIQILRAIRAACADDSRLLISENILPEEPSVSIGATDIWMMNFAGKRRNEAMFNEIAAKAGFRVSSIARHNESTSAVVEMVPV